MTGIARREAPDSDRIEARKTRRLHIVQGEYEVSPDPDVVLTTLLGSCVAACIHDPVAGVGGMNHFLLPEADGPASAHVRYGVNAMELLINGILKLGGRRERLHVWLFGGARLFDRLTDIGSQNADFAEAFVRREELIAMGGSLRGSKARRVQFWPATGRVRQLFVDKLDPAAILPTLDPAGSARAGGSDVELF